MTLEKKKLTDYVKQAKKMLGKNSLSVLSNIVVSVSDDKLHLHCTNLLIHFFAAIPFKKDGFKIDSFEFPKTTFFNSTIFEAVKACKGKEIEVCCIDDSLYFNDIQLPASDIDYSKFPETPFPNEKITSSGTIEKMDTFKRAFDFISWDETRYFMTGVHFALKDGKLQFEATNGRIGFQSDHSMGKSKKPVDIDYIVRDISNFLSLNMTEFETSDKIIAFSDGIYSIHVSIIKGQFPNVSRVVPDLANYEKISFDRKAFSTALEKLLVQLKMRGKIRPGRTRINIENNSISTDHTSAECSVECDTGFPEKVCVGLENLKSILNKKNNFELWMHIDAPSNKVVYIADNILNAIELIMPWSQD